MIAVYTLYEHLIMSNMDLWTNMWVKEKLLAIYSSLSHYKKYYKNLNLFDFISNAPSLYQPSTKK